MWTAITREVSPALAACELSFVSRSPIDVGRAQAQHDAYCAVLESLGCEVIRLPAEPALPDSVFVEDVALAFDEVAVATRPGAVSRRDEGQCQRCEYDCEGGPQTGGGSKESICDLQA